MSSADYVARERPRGPNDPETVSCVLPTGASRENAFLQFEPLPESERVWNGPNRFLSTMW